MTLTPDELHYLRDLGAELRRSDPSLHRALATGKSPSSRRSVWCTVYLCGSVLMLTLGALAGASPASVIAWITLVTLGSAVIRAQDRAGINQ